MACMYSLNKFFCSTLCVLGTAWGPAAVLCIREEELRTHDHRKPHAERVPKAGRERGEGRAELGKLIQVWVTRAGFPGEGLS